MHFVSCWAIIHHPAYKIIKDTSFRGTGCQFLNAKATNANKIFREILMGLNEFIVKGFMAISLFTSY